MTNRENQLKPHHITDEQEQAVMTLTINEIQGAGNKLINILHETWLWKPTETLEEDNQNRRETYKQLKTHLQYLIELIETINPDNPPMTTDEIIQEYIQTKVKNQPYNPNHAIRVEEL